MPEHDEAVLERNWLRDLSVRAQAFFNGGVLLAPEASLANDQASVPGPHFIRLDAAHVGEPGEHPFEVVGAEFSGQPPNITASATGRILHEIEIHQAFPIGHTVIRGVDLWDGHLAHSRQDVLVPGRKLSLDFTRSYSSQGNSSDGPLGAGWTHRYNSHLVMRCGVITVVGGEGSGKNIGPRLPNVARTSPDSCLLVGFASSDM